MIPVFRVHDLHGRNMSQRYQLLLLVYLCGVVDVAVVVAVDVAADVTVDVAVVADGGDIQAAVAE